jgi:hypothetical protein
MADPGAAGFSIREIRPDEYDVLGELTMRAYAAAPSEADAGYQGKLRDVSRRDETRDWEVQPGDWLWSFTLRFEDPA